MYNPQIKDKYSLIDLTRYGTKARKHVHSDVLIGTHPPFPLFKEGDILDANAVLNLMQSAYDQDKVYKILSERIDEVEEAVNDNFYAVHEDIRTVQTSVTDLETKHDQDIRNVKYYVDDKLNDLQIDTDYDTDNEELIIKTQLK